VRVRLLPELKIILQISAISMFAIFLGLSFYNWLKWRELHSAPSSCEAVINVHKDRQQLSIRLKYAFLEEEGSATLSGILLNDGEAAAQVSRQIFFNYKHVNEGVYLENQKTAISQQDTAGYDGLRKLLPAFYMKSGERTSFLIYPQKPGGYVFVKDFIPAFYCAKQ